MTGEEFRELRIKRKYTQRKIAELLGYTGRGGEMTIQNWEYGKQPIPMKHFRKLAEILDVPLETFIP